MRSRFIPVLVTHIDIVFIVDPWGNCTIVYVETFELVMVDLEAVLFELYLQSIVDELATALDSVVDNDDWSPSYGRDNVVPFGDYRRSYFDM